MAIIHLDIVTSTEYTVKNTVKIGGVEVSYSYFTRYILSIEPKPTLEYIVLTMINGQIYLLTHDQTNLDPSIFIIDTIDEEAPTSLLDLAEKLNALVKF